MSTNEIPFHGTCPRCSHFHEGVPIELPNADKPHRRYNCRRCKALLFGLGGTSTQISLASQETSPSSQTRRASGGHAHSCCFDAEAPTVDPTRRPSSASRRSRSPPSPDLELTVGEPTSPIPLPTEVHTGLEISQRPRRHHRLQQRLKSIRNHILGRLKWIISPGRRRMLPQDHSIAQQNSPVGGASSLPQASSRLPHNVPLHVTAPSNPNAASPSRTPSRRPSPVLSADQATDTLVKQKQLEEHRRQRTLARRAPRRHRCVCSPKCPCRAPSGVSVFSFPDCNPSYHRASRNVD